MVNECQYFMNKGNPGNGVTFEEKKKYNCGDIRIGVFLQLGISQGDRKCR